VLILARPMETGLIGSPARPTPGRVWASNFNSVY
jgi:hypothetical protein